MKYFRLKKFSKLLEIVIILMIVFLIPIFFAIILKTNNVFELNKMVLFRILVLVLLFVWGLKAIENARSISTGLPRFTRNDTFFIVSLLLFLLSLIISTVFSINPELSFQGIYDRQEGLLSYFYYFVFFILLTAFLKGSKRKKIILWGMIASSIVVCVYGLMQAFGHDPLNWIESTRARITSTFGQPNNLGSYLLFIIPLTGYFLFKYKSKIFRAFLFLLLSAQLLTLYYTYSSSSWIGFVGGGAVVGIVFLLLRLKQTNPCHPEEERSDDVRIRFTPLRMTMFIIFIFIIGFTIYNIPTSNVFKNRINNLTNLQIGSTAARLQFWQAALKGIKEKPILGYGLETQADVLVKYYQPDWAIHSNVNVEPNRAHNWFLDILLTQGIVGLIAHILLWGSVFYTICRNIRKKHEIGLNYAILTALSSYFIYLQFNFPHATVQIFFWSLVAITLSLRVKQKACVIANVSEQSQNVTDENFFKKIPKLLIVFFFIIFSFCIYYQINKEVKRIIADYYFLEMRQSNLNNRYMAVFDVYKLIKEETSLHRVYNKEFIYIIYYWSRVFNNEYFYKFFSDDFKSVLGQIKTDNFSDLEIKAMIYSFLAGSEEEYAIKADDAYRKLVELSPKIPFIYRQYADFLSMREEYDKAIDNYNLALEKIPSLDAIGLNFTHENAVKAEMRRNYEGLMRVYKKMNEEGEVERFRQLIEVLNE